MIKLNFVMVLVLCIFNPFFCHNHKSEDWVDPHDMLSFDPASKKNVRPPMAEVVLLKPVPDVDEQDFKNEKPKLHYENQRIVEKDLSFCSKCPNRSSQKHLQQKSCLNSEKDLIFMKRFLAFYTEKIKEVYLSGDDTQYEVTIQVSNEAWSIFELFDYDFNKVSLPDVLKYLEETFIEFSLSKKDQDHSWRWKLEDYIHITLQDVCLYMVLALLLMFFVILIIDIYNKISWSKLFGGLIFLMFLISYIWTYVRQYKEAVAKHKASFVGVPNHCIDAEHKMSLAEEVLSFWQNMFSTKKDPCMKYHESHLINPIFMVSPFKVLAATLSEFFLEPFSHIGLTFSTMFRNMFSDLPFTLWIPAFIFVIVAMFGFLMLLSVCFGYTYKLSLPFWSVFEIVPSQNALQLRHHEELVQNYKLQIEDLQRQVATLQENQIRAIRSSPERQEESWFAPLWRFFGSGESHDHDPSPSGNVKPNGLDTGFVSDFPMNERSRNNLRRRKNNFVSPTSDFPHAEHSFDFPHPSGLPSDLPYPPRAPSDLPYPKVSSSQESSSFHPANPSVSEIPPHIFDSSFPEPTPLRENSNRGSVSGIPVRSDKAEPSMVDEKEKENFNPVTEIGFKQHVTGAYPSAPSFDEATSSNPVGKPSFHKQVHFPVDQLERHHPSMNNEDSETSNGASKPSSGEELKSND